MFTANQSRVFHDNITRISEFFTFTKTINELLVRRKLMCKGNNHFSLIVAIENLMNQ